MTTFIIIIITVCTCFATRSGDAEVNHPGIRSRPRGLKEAVKVGSKLGGGAGRPKKSKSAVAVIYFWLEYSLHNMLF